MIKTLILKCASIINHNRKSKVIFYHDIAGRTQYTSMATHFDLFRKHIETIRKEGFEIVSEIYHPFNQVQICFDDGFKGIYDHRVYFADNDIKLTVFLAVQFIGQENYLNVAEILELQKIGFRFQSHTVSHQNLTNFSDFILKQELEHSKTYLESKLNTPVNEICFPIGYFSNRVIKACRSAGYNKLYSSLPGNYSEKDATGIIYRNLVQFLTPGELKATLYGGMSLLRAWYKRSHFIKKDFSR
jgi:peptidoglycan/xylan/chitin deacetylase (PgdA/CDA1 family)